MKESEDKNENKNVILPDVSAPVNIPHGEILSELYAIRSAMAMISENLDEIDKKENSFLKNYRFEYCKRYAEKVWRRFMGKWDDYLLSNVLKELKKELKQRELDTEELRKRIENLSNEKVSLFSALKKGKEIKILRYGLTMDEEINKNIKTQMEKIENEAKNPQNNGYYTCYFFGSWDGFPSKIYYIMEMPIDQQKLLIADSAAMAVYLIDAEKTNSDPQSISDVIEFMSQEEKDDIEKEKRKRLEGTRQLIEAAQRAYKIIDFRDWKNVDLLIYYFETGRADNLKEALQLVDRQLQTKQIVKAINMAADEIGKTIRQSMEALGGALAQSFSLLSNQIQRQGQELKETINEYGTAHINNQRMANALLASIDKSSAQLAEDMDKQMKQVYHIH